MPQNCELTSLLFNYSLKTWIILIHTSKLCQYLLYQNKAPLTVAIGSAKTAQFSKDTLEKIRI